MKTRKFEVRFYQARFLTSELELCAEVTTDNATHYVRQRVDRPDRELWVDLGRTYTPEQHSHVQQLFDYQAPLIKAEFNKWLLAHNFPSTEELPTSNHDVHLQMTPEEGVRYCKWSIKTD